MFDNKIIDKTKRQIQIEKGLMYMQIYFSYKVYNNLYK